MASFAGTKGTGYASGYKGGTSKDSKSDVGSNASKGGASKGAAGAKGAAPGGSGQRGSKGGGASTQQPGAGKNAGQVNAASLGQAKASLASNRNTALGKVSQAAKQNAGYNFSGNQNAARANAVSRGPGISAGLGFGAAPAAFNRTATSYGLANAERLGITDPKRITASLNNLRQFANVSYDPTGIAGVRESLGYTPVGIRTNNPGNLLTSNWQKSMPGYAGPVKSPNGLTYSSYTDPRWGLVAQNELLGRYSDMGRNTIRSVVDRYAPVDENNSAAANRNYKASLSRATGFGLDQALTREQVQSLGPYKTEFENSGRVFAGGPFGAAPVQLASAAPVSIPRPSPRPADLTAAIPRPTPRPPGLTGMVSRNPYDVDRTLGVPRARPPGVGPERVMGVETYIDPATAITRNPYEQQAVARYSGYGAFNPPVRTAPVSRNEYDTQRSAQYAGYDNFSPPVRTGPLSRNPYDSPRPAQYSGYGGPLATLPPAPQAPPRLTPKQFTDRVAASEGPIPGFTKDPSRVPAYPGSMPAGTYTTPYDTRRMSPFGNMGLEYHQHPVPPTPRQYRGEPEPAAPHPGTPASQTAQADEQGGWKSWIKAKTGVDVDNAVQTATEGVNEYYDAVDQYGLDNVQTYANQQAGIVPESMKAAGSNMTVPPGGFAGPSVMPAAQAGEQLPPRAELVALLDAMKAKGAPADEIAFVQELLTQAA